MSNVVLDAGGVKAQLKVWCIGGSGGGHDPTQMLPVGKLTGMGIQMMCPVCGQHVWVDLTERTDEEE